MKAQVVYTDPCDGAQTIDVNGHRIQFGHGSGGDGYCYVHQSFRCIDRLTSAERKAIRDAA